MGLKDRVRRIEDRLGGAPVRFVVRGHGEERPEGEEEPWLSFTLDIGSAGATGDEGERAEERR